MSARSRIALISATTRSLPPVRSALTAQWSEVDIISIIDEALESDRARGEARSRPFFERVDRLARYTIDNGAAGVLFTCSAFAAEVGALKSSLPVPVFRPDEAVYLAAARTQRSVGVLLTFPPAETSAQTLISDLSSIDARVADFSVRVIPDALEAVQRGDQKTHDRLIDTAIRTAPEEVLVMGQYSMTSAGEASTGHRKTVLTGPTEAVKALRLAMDSVR
jgi:hypothetical protein